MSTFCNGAMRLVSCPCGVLFSVTATSQENISINKHGPLSFFFAAPPSKPFILHPNGTMLGSQAGPFPEGESVELLCQVQNGEFRGDQWGIMRFDFVFLGCRSPFITDWDKIRGNIAWERK